MQTIADFPYFEMQFNKEGAIHSEDEVKQVLDFLSQGKATDLFVFSHGWNNDIADARNLYKRFFAQLRKEINSGRPPKPGSRKLAVIGILWPSKKFTDKDLIPSGAAEIGFAASETDIIRRKLEALKGTFDKKDGDAKLDRAKKLLAKAETDKNAATEIIDLIRSLPDKHEIHTDDGSELFFKAPAAKLIDRLSRPDIPVSTGKETGGAADFDASPNNNGQGEAAGFDFFGGINSAIQKVLNFTTYYQMKERAGIVGRTGAYQAMMRIRKANANVKIHLIGHSFGGRLVTALANGPEGGKPIFPESMTLLQAAFSHNGFASKFDKQRDGFFRKVVTEKKVAGPILIVHSNKDTAVGTAYPIASKLSGDDAAEFGGPESRFGGIGRNGAQFTPEAESLTPLGPVTAAYAFKPGKLYNLNADKIIMEHSDIVKPEVAHALLSAVVVM